MGDTSANEQGGALERCEPQRRVHEDDAMQGAMQSTRFAAAGRGHNLSSCQTNHCRASTKGRAATLGVRRWVCGAGWLRCCRTASQSCPNQLWLWCSNHQAADQRRSPAGRSPRQKAMCLPRPTRRRTMARAARQPRRCCRAARARMRSRRCPSGPPHHKKSQPGPEPPSWSISSPCQRSLRPLRGARSSTISGCCRGKRAKRGCHSPAQAASNQHSHAPRPCRQPRSNLTRSRRPLSPICSSRTSRSVSRQTSYRPGTRRPRKRVPRRGQATLGLANGTPSRSPSPEGVSPARRPDMRTRRSPPPRGRAEISSPTAIVRPCRRRATRRKSGTSTHYGWGRGRGPRDPGAQANSKAT
mmetsp:Transcript_128126/g.370923  ORF Transcript_128126/g.370923 Transcript_128126/m.370923 type:complete len:357 (-) Transcript_128126:7-1077(-)